MLTTFELKNRYLKHFRVKHIFLQTFIPPFQKWTFLKCPIFKT